MKNNFVIKLKIQNIRFMDCNFKNNYRRGLLIKPICQNDYEFIDFYNNLAMIVNNPEILIKRFKDFILKEKELEDFKLLNNKSNYIILKSYKSLDIVLNMKIENEEERIKLNNFFKYNPNKKKNFFKNFLDKVFNKNKASKNII